MALVGICEIGYLSSNPIHCVSIYGQVSRFSGKLLGDFAFLDFEWYNLSVSEIIEVAAYL